MTAPDDEEDEEIEDPEVDEQMDTGVRTTPQRDEYSTRDQPMAKSFYDRYGYDERDGPPEEEEEERGYVDDPDKPLDELNYRRR